MQAGFVHVSMPAPLTAAEMASLRARSSSHTLSVDQKGYSRPGSTSSLGTVNITIQPPVSVLNLIAAVRLMRDVISLDRRPTLLQDQERDQIY